MQICEFIRIDFLCMFMFKREYIQICPFIFSLTDQRILFTNFKFKMFFTLSNRYKHFKKDFKHKAKFDRDS